MYWIDGKDTVDVLSPEHRVEEHVWGGTDAQPTVTITQITLDAARRSKHDTYLIAPTGHVQEIDHEQPSPTQRVDLLLLLPDTALVVGTEWTDSVISRGHDADGTEWYSAIRTYRVTRVFDTLGVHEVAQIDAAGAVQMRLNILPKLSRAKAAWMEVSGAVSERDLFDVQGGRLLYRSWSMDLHGSGVSPFGHKKVPAGIQSRFEMTPADSATARFLMAQLPGADSAGTSDASQTTIERHTVQREPGRITSALARNDGLLQIATVTFAGARLRSYESTVANAAGTIVHQGITPRGDSVLLEREGAADTILAIPPEPWAAADRGMEELLVPMLLALPRDLVPHHVAILHPATAQWERTRVIVFDSVGSVFAVFDSPDPEHPRWMLLTPDGDFIKGISGGARGDTRMPADSVRLQRYLDGVYEGRDDDHGDGG